MAKKIDENNITFCYLQKNPAKILQKKIFARFFFIHEKITQKRDF